VRRRLLSSYVVLALVVLALLEIPLAVTYARSERRDLVDRVERDAVAMATLAEDALEHGGALTAAVRRAVAGYRRGTDGRVVVVDADGRRVLDTDPSDSTSFASRPEIRTGLAGDVAPGQRHSATLGSDLLYVAVPVASGGVIHGAVRITFPMDDVDRRIHRYRLVLAAIAGIVLATAGAVALTLVRWVTRPLARLENAADRLGAGELATRAPVQGPSELRRVAETFNAMAVKIDTLVRSQDAFVADASHQLRTPLAALRLRLENLERDAGEAQQPEVAGALREVERLGGIVDGLLALARADRVPAAPVAIDATEVIRGRVAAWEALAEERNVRLAEEAVPSVAVLATPGRLEQVLDNLLANALEVAPAGSTIRIAARTAGKWSSSRSPTRAPG